MEVILQDAVQKHTNIQDDQFGYTGKIKTIISTIFGTVMLVLLMGGI
jgi:hypothetical protein